MNVKETIECIRDKQMEIETALKILEEHLGLECEDNCESKVDGGRPTPSLGDEINESLFAPVVAPELPPAPKKEKKPFLKIGKKEK